jgi:hypothetical protein
VAKLLENKCAYQAMAQAVNPYGATVRRAHESRVSFRIGTEAELGYTDDVRSPSICPG